MAACHRSLHKFRRGQPQSCRKLFEEGFPIDYNGDLLSPARDLGLVERQGVTWATTYRLTWLRELIVVTDHFTVRDPDRVFPLSEDESLLLARGLVVLPGDSVLDIGTGSGILALCAARKARRVVAVDVNPRALAYAQFNSALNGFGDRISFQQSDVFTEVDTDDQFDLVVSNPPVIPAPEGSGFFLHSDGGPEGVQVSETILRGVADHLSSDGRLQMLCTSWSRAENELTLLKSMPDGLARCWNCRVQELYPEPLSPIQLLLEHFSEVSSFDSWHQRIESSGFERLHYLYLELTSRNGLVSPTEPQEVCADRWNGSWARRLERLFLAYRQMDNL